MNKTILIVFISILTLAACKTSKHAKTTPVIQEPKEEVIINEVKPVANDVIIQETEKPIVFKTEGVTLEKSERDKLYKFYVVVGSFSVKENAEKLHTKLIDQGASAVILKSETGMFRVAYFGTDGEQDARIEIAQIRKTLKEYPDVWLLKSK